MSDQGITIQLKCINLPGLEFDGRTAVRLGIQKGKDVIEDVPGNARNVTFKCDFRVEKNADTGKPNFLGPYAQGTPQERFIYLCWGERKGEMWNGFRRAKVHLKDIGWKTVEQALSSGKPIKAVINMTDKKGGPLCASVKAENIEWQL